MPCYCTEISNCNKDIATIREMASELQKISNSNADTITPHLQSLSTACGGAFTPATLASLQDAANKLNDGFSGQVSALIESCNRKIELLSDELTAMETSDREYHESEDE